jgi:hypothetical protein
MAQTPTTEPASLQAGDTLRWQRTLPDYPASEGWVLSYRLINALGKLDIVATAEGDDHLISVAAATSAAYPPGDYTYTAQVTRSTDRYTVGRGSITVKADWAAVADGADARTPAQRALADLKAALLRWLSSQGHVQEYEIAGRRMRFASASDIRQRIALAEREVAAEANAGKPVARRVLVRF